MNKILTTIFVGSILIVMGFSVLGWEIYKSNIEYNLHLDKIQEGQNKLQESQNEILAIIRSVKVGDLQARYHKYKSLANE